MNTYELLSAYDGGQRNFIDADLRSANLTGANLRGANLRGANLTGANLTGANLRGANLTGANLRGANLIGANLRGANLTGANLTGAYLTGAYLRSADLTGAIGFASVQFDSRGHLFVAVLHGNDIMIAAGCRWFTAAEGIAHWGADTYPDKTRGEQYVAAINFAKLVLLGE